MHDLTILFLLVLGLVALAGGNTRGSREIWFGSVAAAVVFIQWNQQCRSVPHLRKRTSHNSTHTSRSCIIVLSPSSSFLATYLSPYFFFNRFDPGLGGRGFFLHNSQSGGVLSCSITRCDLSPSTKHVASGPTL